MQIKIIGGIKCLFKEYQIDSKRVSIGAAIYNESLNQVSFKTRRPSNSLFLEANNILSKEDFFSDIDFLVSYFQKFDGIDDNTISKAFLEICAKHITENGRIIDTDLYIYADESLLVTQNIYIDILGIKLTDESCKAAFPELINHGITYLKQYLFITKYDGSNAQPYLVKFTDIQSVVI